MERELLEDEIIRTEFAYDKSNEAWCGTSVSI